MSEDLRGLLERSPGEFISGEDIARRLGISRAAVWKRVRSLRRRGYRIEGARGAGYRLIERPDSFEKADLLPLLSRPALWKDFLYYAVTDSTNSRAAELAEKGGVHGTVLCANAQTGGRGRMGRGWLSPPGVNVYLSILLRPPVEPARAPQLTLVAAVALAQAVEETCGVAAGLKWPNDLLLDGRKAAGILAEMSADPDRVRHVIVGVGLNVNMEAADFPEDLRERATSLRIRTGRTFRRAELVARFLDAFSRAYEGYLTGGFKSLWPEWKRRDILKGKPATVRLPAGDARGKILGVDGNGMLVFRRAGAARSEKIASGEIVGIGR